MYRLQTNVICCPGNHNGIAKSIGYPNIMKYTYWNPKERKIDMEAVLSTFRVSIKISHFHGLGRVAIYIIRKCLIEHGKAHTSITT